MNLPSTRHDDRLQKGFAHRRSTHVSRCYICSMCVVPAVGVDYWTLKDAHGSLLPVDSQLLQRWQEGLTACFKAATAAGACPYTPAMMTLFSLHGHIYGMRSSSKGSRVQHALKLQLEAFGPLCKQSAQLPAAECSALQHSNADFIQEQLALRVTMARCYCWGHATGGPRVNPLWCCTFEPLLPAR